MHAQRGLIQPQRVVEYAGKALEHPLEPLQVPRLYAYWGDAEQVIRAREPLTDRRKWSAVLYLAGLRDVLRYPLPDKAPELPAVDAGPLGETNPDQAEETRRRHARQVAARQLAEFQAAMIRHRGVLIGQLASLYQHRPAGREEIRELATGVLGNAQAVELLLRALSGARRAPDAEAREGK